MKTLANRLKRSLYIASALFILALSGGFMVQPALAQPCQQISVPVNSAGTTCIPTSSSSSNIQQNPIFVYLRYILIFIGGGVGLAVVGGIVTGSYLYITARSNAGQVQQGQNIIINSVIGLLLFIFMYAILQFLIPGGIFQ